MLWKRYVFRRGSDVQGMWDSLFENRPIRLLYITGRGFDLRAQVAMRECVDTIRSGRHTVERGDLLIVGLKNYHLSSELASLTTENAQALRDVFAEIGPHRTIAVVESAATGEDVSSSIALRNATEQVLARVTDHTDIILDVSTLPRVLYLSLLTALLQKLVPDKNSQTALGDAKVNLQVVAAEDASLDAHIRSEDPSNDLVLIPGFSSALHAESVQDWPLVWFPILGENRSGQFQKVMELAIPDVAEICPIVPHPSRDPRRADRLIVEYKIPLFDTRQTPTSNILHANEAHPFEAYRQILGAMRRYRESLTILGGCRLVVTPLGSKLLTIGAGLACFEMRPGSMGENFGVAIPYAEPTRYIASAGSLKTSRPEICSLLLTGEAYAMA